LIKIAFMPLTREELYKVHVTNHRAVGAACDQVYRQLKHMLASEQREISDSLLKLFLFLVGTWAEVRFLKMLHEPSGFNEADRAAVLEKQTKLDQWNFALELAFRRKYNVPRAPLSQHSMDVTAYHKYREIKTLIDNDLRPIIEIRNKLAHGQWARTLNNEMTEYSPENMRILALENALTANGKKLILERLSNLMNDLVASRAFDRDFNQHYRSLIQAKVNLSKRSYETWLDGLRLKFRRGRTRRVDSFGRAEPHRLSSWWQWLRRCRA